MADLKAIQMAMINTMRDASKAAAGFAHFANPANTLVFIQLART